LPNRTAEAAAQTPAAPADPVERWKGVAETGSAVAIDGQIYQDALFQPIAPDSDVHILPQIAGG